jgi:hypothetical protein
MPRKTTGSTTTIRKKKTVTPIQPTTVEVAPELSKSSNLEEEIRRRAYELYLQRRATAGDESPNCQNQDWLVAEREVRLRFSRAEQSTA